MNYNIYIELYKKYIDIPNKIVHNVLVYSSKLPFLNNSFEINMYFWIQMCNIFVIQMNLYYLFIREAYILSMFGLLYGIKSSPCMNASCFSLQYIYLIFQLHALYQSQTGLTNDHTCIALSWNIKGLETWVYDTYSWLHSEPKISLYYTSPCAVIIFSFIVYSQRVPVFFNKALTPVTSIIF